MNTVQLVLTEKCNLSCSYCYMKNKKTYMQEETWKKIYESINHKEFTIDFFGGEPLIMFDLIKVICETLKKDNRCKKINLYSNGLLLDQEKVNYIKKAGINFYLSFDGLWQDGGVEPYLEKKHLFEQLIKNPICMIPPKKSYTIVQNYKWFLEEFGMIPNFKIIKDNIWSENDAKQFNREFGGLCLSYGNRLRLKQENCLPGIIQHYFLLMVDSITGNFNSFCGAGVNHIAYMPDGSKHQCARFGSLPILYMNPFFMKCDDKCEIYDFCEQGCFYDMIWNKGFPSKGLCVVYKSIYHNIIELNHWLIDNQQWQTIVMQLLKGEKYIED